MSLSADTGAELIDKTVDERNLTLAAMRSENAPVVRLRASSPLDDGTRAVEYSFRVDEGFWRPFSTARDIEVRDAWLHVQGTHAIEVRARVAGDAASLDETPARIEIVIDTEPPAVAVSEVEDGVVQIDVRDAVSTLETKVRIAFDGGAWSDWRSPSEVSRVEVGEAAEIEVEAIDEEGNVASVSQPLIRGRATAEAGGCGCRLPGGTPAAPVPGAPTALIAAAFLAMGLHRRARDAKP